MYAVFQGMYAVLWGVWLVFQGMYAVFQGVSPIVQGTSHYVSGPLSGCLPKIPGCSLRPLVSLLRTFYISHVYIHETDILCITYIVIPIFVMFMILIDMLSILPSSAVVDNIILVSIFLILRLTLYTLCLKSYLNYLTFSIISRF